MTIQPERAVDWPQPPVMLTAATSPPLAFVLSPQRRVWPLEPVRTALDELKFA